LLDPKAAAESRQKLEAEIDARVEKKLREGVAHKVLDIINPRHDAEIGLSMFIAQSGQYSIQSHEQRTMDNLLTAASTVSLLFASCSYLYDSVYLFILQLEAAGDLHNEFAKNAVTAVATSAADSLDAQLAQIEKLESMLAIAKEKIVADKAVWDKQVAEQRVAAEVEASRVAKRKRREEGAAGFAVRDAILAEDAAAENGAVSSSDAPAHVPSDTEEVVKGRSKRQRRI
jgi:hypothetical protein